MKKNRIILILIMALSINLHADISNVEEAKESCESGNAIECFHLAFMYDFGEGVEQDTVKATELYTKSCDIGYAGGCLVLGSIYHAGIGVTKDILKAKRLYSKACDGGSNRGCRENSILKVKDKIASN